MVKHVVMFKFKGSSESRLEAAQHFAAALLELPKKIEVLNRMEVGINQNPAESWDLVLTAVVDKMEDVAIYSAHPAHVAAAALIADVKENRACVDYTI